MNLVRYADRPDLRARRYEELTRSTVPEYMNQNEPGDLYWDRLYTDFPDFQVALVDGDELLAEAHAISLPWDGTLDDLPSGWDEGFTRGSMTITGSPAEWEEWTGMAFPEDGTHVVPGCLAPVTFLDGIGTPVEPNVWVHHRV